MDKVWDLKIEERSQIEQERIEADYKIIKKRIGSIIFRRADMEPSRNNYYLARELYREIFKDSDENLSFSSTLNLKYFILKSHSLTINDVIQNEFKKILEQNSEIERLKLRLKFYETTFPQPFLKDLHNT